MANDQTFLVDPLLPLTPGQQGDHVFLVLQKSVASSQPCTPAPYTKILIQGTSSYPVSAQPEWTGRYFLKNEKKPFFSQGLHSAPVTV